jgi:hypothetical protein
MSTVPSARPMLRGSSIALLFYILGVGGGDDVVRSCWQCRPMLHPPPLQLTRATADMCVHACLWAWWRTCVLLRILCRHASFSQCVRILSEGRR